MAPDTRGTEKDAARTPRGGGWVVAQSILLVALVASGPAHPGDWHAPAGLAFGLLSFLAAGVLGVAGVARLGSHRSPYPVPKEDSRLVRDGVYAFCRHPMYASLLLAGLGWTLIWQSGWTAAVALIQVPFFTAKARVEERYLRRRFPEYEVYARRVKRFLPGVF